MTQDKMRRIITACVSAATVLLVFLLGYLIYQWIAISNRNDEIEKLEFEIAQIERQIEESKEGVEFYESDLGLEYQYNELLQRLENLQGK